LAHLDAALPIVSYTHDLHIRLRPNDSPEPIGKEGLVVYYGNPDHC
jgi:hypothetical protein